MHNDTLASKIDHTLLKPDATRQEVERTCQEALEHGFAGVCVSSTHVGLAAQLLRHSSVLAIAVVGFPLGSTTTAAKVCEAKEAIRDGAQEIDMVIQIGALKDRDYALVLSDIRQVVEAAHPHPVKVIIEISSLNEDQKIIASALAQAAGAAFVKTSTGFGAGGATVEDIALIKRVISPQVKIKASGGIRTHQDAIRMIEAGASRIGASSSVAIVTRSSTGPAQGASTPGQNPKDNHDKKSDY